MKIMEKAPSQNFVSLARWSLILEVHSNCHRFRDSLDSHRFAVFLVKLDHDAMQDDAIFGDLESLGHAGQESLNDRRDFPAENTLVRARETGIAQESSAAGEDLFIGGLDMRVGADHDADLAIEHARERNFLGSRFGVEIDEDDFGLLTELFDFVGSDYKRIFQRRLHECAALQIHNSN